MRSHNKISVALLFAIILTVLLSACGAERPEHSVNLKCINGDVKRYYEIGVTSDSVSFWYKDDLKAYISETALPQTIENVSYAKSNMYFADVNSDGYEDLVVPYRTEGDDVYSFILINAQDNTFEVYEGLHDKPNLSAGRETLTSSEKIGDFGEMIYVYSIDEEDGSIIEETSYIENTNEVIRSIASEFYGNIGYKVEHPFRNTPLGIRFGRIQIGNTYGTAYVLYREDALAAVMVIGDDGEWYIDDGCISLYKRLTISGRSVTVADDELIVSSGVPYSQLDVDAYIELSAEEQENICNAMARFINDNGEALETEGLYATVTAAVAQTTDTSVNFFEFLCSTFGIDEGVFLDW